MFDCSLPLECANTSVVLLFDCSLAADVNPSSFSRNGLQSSISSGDNRQRKSSSSRSSTKVNGHVDEHDTGRPASAGRCRHHSGSHDGHSLS